MVEPNLASKIPESQTNIKAYISKANRELHESLLTENKFLRYKAKNIVRKSSLRNLHILKTLR